MFLIEISFLMKPWKKNYKSDSYVWPTKIFLRYQHFIEIKKRGWPKYIKHDKKYWKLPKSLTGRQNVMQFAKLPFLILLHLCRSPICQKWHAMIGQFLSVSQWRNFARGCPWARDGWVIKKRLREVQKIEACNAREPCGVGSRGPLKGPDGVQGAKPPEAPVHFNAIQHFQRKLIYVRLLRWRRYDLVATGS